MPTAANKAEIIAISTIPFKYKYKHYQQTRT